MNNHHRYLSGFLSSLLLSVGMVRAAENFDPLKSANVPITDKDSIRSAWACVPCDLLDR
jgi:hypothetical protein